jgi:hypothetical protein
MPHAPDTAAATSDADGPHHERTALKEWAVLCDAMAAGEIVAMVRKGGIREQRAGFAVRHDRFLLYPTFFHEKGAELQERFRGRLAASHGRQPAAGTIRLELVASVAGVWAVGDLERLRAVEPSHGLAWPAVESRFHYRNRPGVQVVAVRVARLPAPVVVPEARRYLGCVSWVALDAPLDVRGAVPVLDDAAFDARLAPLRAALGAPSDAS